MAKQIKRNDIAEDDIFALVKSSATSAIEKVNALNTELTKVGTSFKEGLGKLKTDNASDIDKLVKKVKELTEYTKQQTEAIIQQEKVKRELEKTERELEKSRALKKKNEDDELARLTKLTTAKQQAYEKEYALLVKSEAEIKRLDALKKKASDDELIRLEKLRLAEEKVKNQTSKNLADITKAQLDAQAKTDAINANRQKELDRQLNQANRVADRDTKLQEKANREAEKARKLAEEQANAYKRLEKNTRELKNASKQLGAEMLELERSGKRNTAEYYKLEQQYKKVTQSALEGDKALKKLDQSVGDNFRSVGNYTKALGGLKNMFFQLVGAFGAVDLVKFLVGTQVKLDSLNLALRNVSGSTKEYQANFAFLKDLSLSYGQDLLGLISTYKNFIASTTESNLTLGERRRIYESIIKSGSALALSNDDIQGSLRAVQQMFSKGTIQAEELRQQLGDRLPGAFKIMAKAVGVTEAELGKMMKNGEVFADDIMPRFAVLLEEEFGKKASLNLQTLNGAFNVLKTNITLYFDQAQKNISVNKTLAFLLLTIGKNIGTLFTALRQLTTAFLTYKLITTATSVSNKIMATSFKEVASSALKGEKSVTMFGLSLKSIAFIAVLDGLVKLTEYFIDLAKGTDQARDAYEKYENATKRGNKRANAFLISEQDKLNKARGKYLEQGLKGEALKIKMQEEEAKRIENIKNKVQELGKEQDYYEKRRAEIRARNNGKAPQVGKAPILEGMTAGVSGGSAIGGTASLSNQQSKSAQEIYEKAKKQYELDKEAFKKYSTIGAELTRVNEELLSYNEELQKNDILSRKTTKDVKDAHYAYKPYIKDLKDAKIEYKTINDYVERHIELLREINMVRAEQRAYEATSAYETELKKQQEQVGLTGEYNSGKLSQLKQKETDALIDLEKRQREVLSSELDKSFNLKMEQLYSNLDKEKEDYLSKYAEQRKKMETAIANADVKEFNAQNATKKGKAKALADAKYAREFAKKQTEQYEKDTQEVTEKFEQRRKEIEAKGVTEKKEIDAQKIAITEDTENKILNIKKKASEEWTEEEKALVKAHDEFELERIKRISETANSFIQNSLEYYIRTAETRIKQLDTYMTKLSNQMDFLQANVASGSITAQESLAKVEKEQQEAEKQKLKEQRKAQRLQMAQTVFNAYNSNVQNSKVGENALTKTLSDVTLLSAFIGSLPTYFDGTEDTGTNGQGLDGKGGFHAILHPNERVIPKELNMKMGDLSNIEIAKLAEDKVRGNIMSRGEGAVSLMNNSWQTELIISELKDLKNTIKNKPETNVEVGEILGGVMKIVETKKMGNQTTRNITRLS